MVNKKQQIIKPRFHQGYIYNVEQASVILLIIIQKIARQYLKLVSQLGNQEALKHYGACVFLKEDLKAKKDELGYKTSVDIFPAKFEKLNSGVEKMSPNKNDVFTLAVNIVLAENPKFQKNENTIMYIGEKPEKEPEKETKAKKAKK